MKGIINVKPINIQRICQVVIETAVICMIVALIILMLSGNIGCNSNNIPAEQSSKNMICMSPDALEQLIYEFVSIHKDNNAYNLNQGETTMERLSCLFPGVGLVQNIEPDLSETTISGTTTTIYERFSEGIGRNPVTGKMDTEIEVYIRKTTITVEGNVQSVRKQKAIGLWSKRTEIEYIGINAPFNEFSVR